MRAHQSLTALILVAGVSLGCTEHDRTGYQAGQVLAGLEWRRVGSSPLPVDLRLMPGVGDPAGEGSVVAVTPTRITLGAQTLERLRDGQLDPDQLDHDRVLPLYDALQLEPGPESARLLFAIDNATPMSTVIHVIYTASRAGFADFGFVVESAGAVAVVVPFRGLRTEYVPVDPAEPRDRDGPVNLSLLTIELTDEGFSLGSPQRRPELYGLAEIDAVRVFAEQIRNEWPTAQRVVVSAAPTVEFGRVIEAILAARGPNCAPPSSRCLLPDVMIGSGGVHGYLPVMHVMTRGPHSGVLKPAHAKGEVPGAEAGARTRGPRGGALKMKVAPD